MTGERETVNALRHKLGLKDLTPDDSKLSFTHQSRKNIDQSENKRGLFSSSVSPDHSMPSMVGLKSTTYGRGISLEKTTGVRNKIFDKDESIVGAQKYQS